MKRTLSVVRNLIALVAIAACNEETGTRVDAHPVDSSSQALIIELVGHVKLDTDSNLGLAIAGNYAYVGHRYEGTIDIIDISNPALPVRVGEFTTGSNPTELRAIADLARLYVLVAPGDLVIFDITNPASPAQISSFTVPGALAHEFFLWRDPTLPSRMLAVISDVSTSGGFAVLDVSDANAVTSRHRQTSSPVHSVSVSDDGARMYLSYISGEVGVMDSAQLMGQGAAQPATLLGKRRISDCAAQSPTCIAHSTVKVPGRALAVTTTENEKCPKGWIDIVDVSNESMPTRVGTWRHPYSTMCDVNDRELGLFGYGAHNPTVTANLALVSWYRAGFLVFDISDPAMPVPVGSYVPNAPPGSLFAWGRVATVSYPIIKDGLIYVVDGRNGLDILRYVGPRREEVDGVHFLEGNSNLR